MGVQSTSLEVYRGEVEPKLGEKQLKVLVAFQMAKRGICNQELADYLQWPINSITPRVKELRELGKIEKAFTAVYPPTNRRVIYWQPSKKEQQVNDCI